MGERQGRHFAVDKWTNIKGQKKNVNISKDVEQKYRPWTILARTCDKSKMRILEVNFRESKKC